MYIQPVLDDYVYVPKKCNFGAHLKFQMKLKFGSEAFSEWATSGQQLL